MPPPSPPEHEPMLKMSDGREIPQLAFGLYKVSPEQCEGVVLEAIEAGYRHFDTASFYGNEAGLGRALKRSELSRDNFFVCTKVWNDAQKAGRAAVRESVERSLSDLDSEYIDLFLVHWPVPGCHLETYRELELLVEEGKVRSIGISNYSEEEYKELVDGGIRINPTVNQMEVSPAMYRPETIDFFAERGIVVSASKALHRGDSFSKGPIQKLAQKYSVTPAQVMLRWGLEKGLVLCVKTSNVSRMHENRSIFHFALDEDDCSLLDAITRKDDVVKRNELEMKRKRQL